MADDFPEFAQLGDPCLSRIAGDDGGVDPPDRGARDPIGVEVGLGKCFVDARLVGAESAATLQQKRDAVEGRTMLQLMSFLRRWGGVDTALAETGVSRCGMVRVMDTGLIAVDMIAPYTTAY